MPSFGLQHFCGTFVLLAFWFDTNLQAGRVTVYGEYTTDYFRKVLEFFWELAIGEFPIFSFKNSFDGY